MRTEINLLRNYPKTIRNTKERFEKKSPQDILIARKFDYEYFDGDRKYGYGGYYYNKKYWENTASDFIDYYKLNSNSSILDIGCGKGFMLYEIKKKLPNIKIKGIDISKYAINNAKEEVKKYLQIGNASKLEFDDNSFDLITSIVTLHNLNYDDCAKSLQEINRVSKKDSFITVDAYSNSEEKVLMEEWNLTALTVMHVDEWKKFFIKNNYNGDFFWFNPLS
jgi:ubiquinone/menaquinone biosynthesis C-methylase UbiE